MRTLVHICCGPCGITVLQRLRKAGHVPSALFFNPNIHPLAEYLRRREGAKAVCKRLDAPFIAADSLPEGEQRWAFDAENTPPEAPLPEYAPGQGKYRVSPAANPAPWLASVANDPKNRCSFCWQTRLDFCASYAARHGFDAFTTSLLYSRYQNHEVIRRMGEKSAARYGLGFVYEDFRTSWQEGITFSKEWGIYRQQYCGCVYSEYERYAKDFARTTSGLE
ncbi:epoxyqueuosine reductase QueH [Desulfovibrio sp. OttesenSCG-928-G15]|nr:epoxyqueuosine reductase QueH [Desulfovibrio sp. OttesenSCG-928-G15]